MLILSLLTLNLLLFLRLQCEVTCICGFQCSASLFGRSVCDPKQFRCIPNALHTPSAGIRLLPGLQLTIQAPLYQYQEWRDALTTLLHCVSTESFQRKINSINQYTRVFSMWQLLRRVVNILRFIHPSCTPNNLLTIGREPSSPTSHPSSSCPSTPSGNSLAIEGPR